jgi:hypothetical protein
MENVSCCGSKIFSPLPVPTHILPLPASMHEITKSALKELEFTLPARYLVATGENWIQLIDSFSLPETRPYYSIPVRIYNSIGVRNFMLHNRVSFKWESYRLIIRIVNNYAFWICSKPDPSSGIKIDSYETVVIFPVYIFIQCINMIKLIIV